MLGYHVTYFWGPGRIWKLSLRVKGQLTGSFDGTSGEDFGLRGVGFVLGGLEFEGCQVEASGLCR